ncbi:hypothetical protein NC651_005792 [Populus alba x Populus x berolinensis]|nr:hypothetical protein NC651_005792 [Populus alba x Populus x berolinensis]
MISTCAGVVGILLFEWCVPTFVRVMTCQIVFLMDEAFLPEFVWMRLWSWSQLPLVNGLVSIDRLTTNAACLLHSLARLNGRENSGQKGSIQIQNKMKTGNNISSWIPPKIGNAAQPQALDLSSNQSVGGFQRNTKS